MDRRSYWSGSNVFSRIYGLYYAESEYASQVGYYNGWWMAAFFENGPISEEYVWDEGVHQTVTMASFDHFAQILLIQILLILVFFAVAFYVSKKTDMAKGIISCIFHGWRNCFYGFFHFAFHCS